MAVRATYAQMERLIEYMEDNPQLAQGQMRCNIGRFETKRKWEELAMILNSMERLKKDTNQWTRLVPGCLPDKYHKID